MNDIYERRFYKAQPVGEKAVPPVALIFDGDLPVFIGNDWATQAQVVYDEEAAVIEVELFNTLPGGSYDALLRHMLTRRASLLRVRFG